MRFTFTGKNITLTDSLKERAEQKLGRLERLLPNNAEVMVAFSIIKQNNKVEVTVPLRNRTLRAEVTATDMNAAIDSVIDVLEKQMVKYKTRLRDKSRKDASFKEEFNYLPLQEEVADASSHKIERTKRFALKPMDAEEAVMEMELLGHNFYMFRNGSTDEVNVVYKRNDGSYGLIEPEY